MTILYYYKLASLFFLSGIEPYITLYDWDLPHILEDRYEGRKYHWDNVFLHCILLQRFHWYCVPALSTPSKIPSSYFEGVKVLTIIRIFRETCNFSFLNVHNALIFILPSFILQFRLCMFFKCYFPLTFTDLSISTNTLTFYYVLIYLPLYWVLIYVLSLF